MQVDSLLASEAFRRRCSDRLLQMLPVVGALSVGHTYCVCDVLPQDPTEDQLGDLAFRLSSFLEDLRVLHVDWRRDEDQLAWLCSPLRLPIIHRARLEEEVERSQLAVLSGLNFLQEQVRICRSVVERETFCLLYMYVSPWWLPTREVNGKVVERSWSRQRQTVAIDDVARRHGLRCVEPGVVPGSAHMHDVLGVRPVSE